MGRARRKLQQTLLAPRTEETPQDMMAIAADHTRPLMLRHRRVWECCAESRPGRSSAGYVEEDDAWALKPGGVGNVGEKTRRWYMRRARHGGVRILRRSQ
jgi:hypothetical protein